MEILENLDTKVGKLYQRDRILVFFPETGKSWSRTYIRQIIPKCGSIKSKTVTKVGFFICVQMGSNEENPGTS